MADSLIPCPACRTTLRVPEPYRGKVLKCLQCQTALFASPLGTDATLTLAPPYSVHGGFPPRIFIAMAALLILGVGGAVVNGFYAVQFATDPTALEKYAGSTISQMVSIQMFGVPKKDEQNAWDPETTERRAKEWVAEHGSRMTAMTYVFGAVSLLVASGGLAIALRKPYWLAWVGCVAALINLNHGCCFPGVVASIWGMAILFSNEGRRYFGLDAPTSPPLTTT